ncbi:dephospho-CoA kinase [Cytophaga sp. FL35]|uniref:dephospho-CoA kinase n=1 Tax=Cytophaga sp. FL35 TaxID=1904456 RepID=UPI001653D38E|nr:dephospho-CoA kinase [Cytophaga sp. FL35]MBC6998720.1 dephospho-CoA kinase [Cytophaga sp. FL35]
MITVGLTGGIGSGKTTVAKMFQELGVPVYNSDKEAKSLMVLNDDVKQQIIQLLGEEAYVEGNLNRAFISKKIFNDPNLLRSMNAIVHPAVRNDFTLWREVKETPYVIQESALIFETGSPEFYDQIVLVTAPLEERIHRVMLRDPNSNRKKVEERISNQLPDSKKAPFSHFIIENLDLKDTHKQVVDIHLKLLAIAEKTKF